MRSWLKPAKAKPMSEVDAAWLAGFIDGEGSVTTFKGGRNGAYDCWRISVPNTSMVALEKCKEITGVGAIGTKGTVRPAHHKPQHQWQVNAQRDIASICLQILPYSVIKREAIERFLASWQDVPAAA